MGLAPDLVGSAATATGDDIVAAGRFTLTGRSAATDSTVIGQGRGRGLRISRSAGVGALAAAGPTGAEQPIVIAVSSFPGVPPPCRRQRPPRPVAHVRPAPGGDHHPRPPERADGRHRGHLDGRSLRARGRAVRHRRASPPPCTPCPTSTAPRADAPAHHLPRHERAHSRQVAHTGRGSGSPAAIDPTAPRSTPRPAAPWSWTPVAERRLQRIRGDLAHHVAALAGST